MLRVFSGDFGLGLISDRHVLRPEYVRTVWRGVDKDGAHIGEICSRLVGRASARAARGDACKGTRGLRSEEVGGVIKSMESCSTPGTALAILMKMCGIPLLRNKERLAFVKEASLS